MKNYLVLLRKINKMNQTMFGKQIGVSQSTISDWERGRSDIDISSLIKISEKFNVSIDWILTGKDHRLTDDEMQIINQYRKLDDEKKSLIHEIIENITSK